MDLRQGIIEAAEALGISPLDLATAISYETAGTFDPLKWGPRTKWGRHRGLIQWGEPQARKYGVDWSKPLASQLGRDGAIVSYLRDAGVRKGMGLLDIYSAINAGRVGRYGASDAHNGGAWGTVADKVRYQMAAHRRKAALLMGGKFRPTFTAGGGAGGRPGTAPASVFRTPSTLAARRMLPAQRFRNAFVKAGAGFAQSATLDDGEDIFASLAEIRRSFGETS